MVRTTTRKLKYLIIHRVLSLDDTPHRIALGVAIGVFVTWTPTIGLQMVLTIAIATLLKANKFVGVPVVWLSNPFTLVPIYYPSHLLGCWITGSQTKGAREILRILRLEEGWYNMLIKTMDMYLTILLGSIVIGLVLSVITYYITRFAIRKYRMFRKHHPHLIRRPRREKQSSTP